MSSRPEHLIQPEAPSLHRTLLTLAGSSVAVNVGAMLLAFLTQVVLARLMGAGAYGEYAYILVWVNLLVFIGKFGWDTAALRFVPVLMSAGQYGEVGAFKRRALKSTVALSALLMMCMAAAAFAIDRFADTPPVTMIPTLLASVLVPVFAMTLIWAAFSQASQRIFVAQGVPNLLRPALIALGIVLVSVAQPVVTVTMAMAITVMVAIAVCVLSWRLEADGRIGPESAQTPKSPQTAPDWNRTAATMFAVTTLTTLLNQMDLLILGVYESGAVLGLYAAAARLAMLVPFPTTAANTGLAPLVARLHAEGKHEQIKAAIGMSSRWTTVAAAGAFGGLALTGHWCLSLFGEDFRGGASILLILAGARFIQALTGLGGHLLNMTGHHRQAACIVAIAVVAQAFSSIPLIGEFGGVGAAVAACVGTAVWGVLTIAACIRYLHVNPLAMNWTGR